MQNCEDLYSKKKSMHMPAMTRRA